MDVRTELQRFIREPRARRDPRALYDHLLAQAPVLAADDSGRVVYVSGYDEIVALSKNPAAITDFARVGIDISRGLNYADLLAKMLPMRAGADHARLRRLATTAFSARTIDAVRPAIDQAVADLLEPHFQCGHLDVVTDLARPLPVAVSLALLDIPTPDRDRVGQWAQQFTNSLVRQGKGELLDVTEMRDYIIRLCQQRRRHPGPDLISHLVAAHDDGTIDGDELVAFVVMLFINGLDTLTAGLTLAIWYALQNPMQLARLTEHPEEAERMFDESLRLAGPVRASARVLVKDVDVGSSHLPAGTAVVLLYAAANRDPARFPEPDRMILHRPSRHLAFGYGAHHCLGASVSLAAGGSVLRALAACGPSVSTNVTTADAPWSTSLPFAGLDYLPLTFAASAARVPVTV
jgi:cytochrome P450